ncbi:hypothetical protein KGF57_000267 [Candida theae]|uniref:Uncharacterized protein n=1 Tax=Candida theae TaxID=1198502 RepID=A0AAD5BJ86_9ASCO|nr:uncharacterized protein KGF57_000267 [Candida theae]KAI5968041.1 hypothetical protein KGF57_000267 [Candida theae]
MHSTSIAIHWIIAITTFFYSPHIQSHSLEETPVTQLEDLRDLPSIHQFKNLEDLQQNMHQFLYKINHTLNSQHLVVHLTDLDTLVFPDDGDPDLKVDHVAAPSSQHTLFFPGKEAATPPENWIELHGSEIIQQSSARAIEVQTLSTVEDDSARGEVAYSTGRLKKVSSEYDSKMSLYLGFIAFIGISSGITFAPEFEFSTSTSIYYTCPVLAGETVAVKVYPTLTTFTPYTRKIKWDHKLSKFAAKSPFTKMKKVSLFTLTGLEDVECFYL